MAQVATRWHGIQETVTCDRAVWTLQKYMGHEDVETSYRAEVKGGFLVDAQADGMPYIRMHVTPETMKVLLDLGLITYTWEEGYGTYEAQCAKMEANPAYPDDGNLYWFTIRWERVTTWEEIQPRIDAYREILGDQWGVRAEWIIWAPGYGSGYEIMTVGPELAPYHYAGIGAYVTDETMEKIVEKYKWVSAEGLT